MVFVIVADGTAAVEPIILIRVALASIIVVGFLLCESDKSTVSCRLSKSVAFWSHGSERTILSFTTLSAHCSHWRCKEIPTSVGSRAERDASRSPTRNVLHRSLLLLVDLQKLSRRMRADNTVLFAYFFSRIGKEGLDICRFEAKFDRA